jgi:hypothetical protein
MYTAKKYAVRMLNEALALHPQSIHTLFNIKASCNQELAGHPTILCDSNISETDGSEAYTLGVLGLINGLFCLPEDDVKIALFPEGPRISHFGLLTVNEDGSYLVYED